MAKKSAGILVYRLQKTITEVLLVHPGGPFWKNKDHGAWSIPKGELDENEDPLAAAIREVSEETGVLLKGEFIPLEPIRQKSGKMVYAWAHQTKETFSEIKSNVFKMEWPPRSGKSMNFPEVDKAEWFSMEDALLKIIPGQSELLHQLRILIN